MPTKKQIIIFGVLCVVALGLGYWSGPFKKDSGQRAEGGSTNIVTVQPSVKAEFNPIIEKEIRNALKDGDTIAFPGAEGAGKFTKGGRGAGRIMPPEALTLRLRWTCPLSGSSSNPTPDRYQG